MTTGLVDAESALLDAVLEAGAVEQALIVSIEAKTRLTMDSRFFKVIPPNLIYANFWALFIYNNYNNINEKGSSHCLPFYKGCTCFASVRPFLYHLLFRRIVQILYGATFYDVHGHDFLLLCKFWILNTVEQ